MNARNYTEFGAATQASDGDFVTDCAPFGFNTVVFDGNERVFLTAPELSKNIAALL